MTLQKRLLLVGCVALVAGIVSHVRHRPDALVARHVCSPVPAGVRDLSFRTTDRFGVAIEWAAHLSFCAPSEAMRATVDRSGFQPSSVAFASLAPKGPKEWRRVETLGPQARVYFRVHQPRHNARWLRIGQNRRWSEVLWIDETGTNAFLTMWDTD